MNDELKGKIADNYRSATKKVKNFVVRLLVFIAVFSAGVGTGYFAWAGYLPQLKDDKNPGNDHIVTITVIETIIEQASELVTLKYHFKDAASYENFKVFFGKKVPFTTDKAVFTYKGTVAVGIELSEVKYKLDMEKKVITIELPELKITSNDIDPTSFEYPFKSDSIFNPTDMEDFTKLQAELEQAKAKEVLGDQEFMLAARSNTENVLRDFLTSADATKEFIVNFK